MDNSEMYSEFGDTEDSPPLSTCHLSQTDKQDLGKPDMSLVPIEALALGLSQAELEGIAAVRKWATKTKYPDADGWRRIPNGANRFRAAAIRHYAASITEYLNPESGLRHYYHFLTSVVMAMSIEMQNSKPDGRRDASANKNQDNRNPT